MWFIYALITTLAWGAADLFYKKGAVPADKYSHLKTTMCVGVVMGIHAVCVLIFGHIGYNPLNLLRYFPVSFMYILSMAIGYFGLRYLMLSISSPIQNSSGAVTCILCLVILGQTMDVPSAVAVVLICVGIFMLGLYESRADRIEAGEEKGIRGVKALMIPVVYCIIDALGTFFDAYYLDDVATTPLIDVTEETLENVANVSYELTFLFVAILIFIFLRFIKHERIRIPEQRDRGIAAVFETAGQFTYVFAMSGNGVVAAPMVASYSIVSLILSAIFLRERLTKKQWACVVAVLVGIVLLGVSEGLAE